MLLEKLLAKEDVEAGVSLVGNIDDVGVLSLRFLTFHSLILKVSLGDLIIMRVL